MITVVNKYAHIASANDVNIMRPSPLGNPFSHKHGTLASYQVSTRQEAVAAYKKHLVSEINLRNPAILKALKNIQQLSEAGSVNLVCCCKPLACHGDVIKELIESNLYQFNV